MFVYSAAAAAAAAVCYDINFNKKINTNGSAICGRDEKGFKMDDGHRHVDHRPGRRPLE